MNRMMMIAAALLLAACAPEPVARRADPATPPMEAAPARQADPAPLPKETAPRRPVARPSVAPGSLLDQAARKAAAGDTKGAIVLAERALRTEPRNPHAWYRLAELYLKQGDAARAEQHAQKSIRLARGDRSLQAQAWHLIERTRRLAGNPAGAREAAAMAEALEGD